MACVVQRLVKNETLKSGMLPKWLAENIHYEVMMGSVAYGVSGDSSDVDVYGFAVPPKTVVFPHLAGEIDGFGTPVPKFEQWQLHHVKDQSSGNEYDFAIYNIVKFFNLVMNNNPNMVDSLFVPARCVLFQSKLAQHVRENRKMFLHRGSYHKFKGYAYAQMGKLGNHQVESIPTSLAIEAILKKVANNKDLRNIATVMMDRGLGSHTKTPPRS